jgi:hypothetical protein
VYTGSVSARKRIGRQLFLMTITYRKAASQSGSLYEYHHRNHSMDDRVKGRVALRHKS